MTRIGSLVCATFLALLLAAATAGSVAAADGVTRATATTGDFTVRVQARVAGGRTRTTATLSRAGTVTRRFVVRDVRGRHVPDPGQAVLTSRGDVAVAVRTGRRDRLVVAPVGGKVRTLVASGSARGLVIEDDRTVRWRSGEDLRYHDLAPFPPGQCPQRARFAPLAERGDAIFTQATYDGRDVTVVRACVKATGQDRVVAQARTYAEDTVGFIPVAAAGTVVAIMSSGADKYSCSGLNVTTTDVRDGRTLREGTVQGPEYDDCGEPPTANDPVVLGPDGAFAWVDRGVLRGLTAGGKVRELDRGGVIANLRLVGDGVAWTRDGVERSAPVL